MKAKSLSIVTEGLDVGSGSRVPVIFEFEPYGDHILVTVKTAGHRIEQAAINRDNLKAASLLRD
jgi:hypothetical protein